MRKAGGFRTARAFAARADWSESKVSRVEYGTQPSGEHFQQYAGLHLLRAQTLQLAESLVTEL
ncbi:hypothetical protein ACQEVX_05235 [Streptomyces syringium]|uniref:hypothetical protein n=1 Tax=Streptomyces syringium TaxID=76729 RepID=UPI003D8FCF09